MWQKVHSGYTHWSLPLLFKNLDHFWCVSPQWCDFSCKICPLGRKVFYSLCLKFRKKDRMSFFIFSVVNSKFKKLYWAFYWIMYQSGFPVQSTRNLLWRGHNRIPEISAEHFVSKLVSVILESILSKGDDWLKHG